MNIGRPTTFTSYWLSVVLFISFTASGCSHFDLKKNIPWGAGEDGESASPMKVVAVWTDTILNQAGQPSLRGYGGRLMFYASEGGKPIKVRGALVVYAFDETGRDTEHVKPDRKYVFTAEQFAKHYSKSALGHSYSVWLPWDEAGGPRREISLLVRFTPENAPVVIGEPSRHNLPGYAEEDATQYPATPAPSNAQPALQSNLPGILPNVAAQPLPATMYAPTPNAVQHPVMPVAYQAPVTGDAPTVATNESPVPRRMSTTTINLPTSVRARAQAQMAMATPPTANAVPLGNAAYSQLTPLQAAVAALNGAPTNGAATFGHNAAVTPSPAVAANVNPAAIAAVAPAGIMVPAAVAAPVGAPVPPATHFGPQRLRTLGAPLERLTRDRGPWPQSR